MRITVHARGGLSVFGGSYDPQSNVAKTNTDQAQTVEIVFPEEITALDLSSNGISATTPTIAANKATFSISGTGSLECVATMGTQSPKVVIQAETCGTDGYGTA